MKTSLRRVVTPQCRQGLRINHRPRSKTRPSSQHPRRQFLRLAAGAVALPAVSRVATAQTYPTRPITMIVPYGAGSATDVWARVLAEWMGRSLGQPIVIENVTGADGSIGVGRVARARPDGQTIVLGTMATHVLNGAYYSAHSTVKCNGQIFGVEENLARGLVAEYLSGARVEFILDPLDIGI